MSVDDERLMAFADGELSGAERAEVEAALAQDASLREKLAAHQRLRTRLSSAFDGVLDEPVPASLLAAAPRMAEVVNLAERRATRWSVREWSAMAASVVLGLFVGVGVMNTQAPLIAPSEGGLIARGALADALQTQLASDEAGAVRIGLSFRDADGRYCRTFDLTEGGTAGLACREGDAWNVAMTVAGAGGGEVRQAAASEQILSAVDAIIVGEPLDAAGETQARDAGWE
ncbi:anti-sigma factor family protein [Vitreimonas flagellata]|uniref:anti-sigma factor family protein n=1 Tax=Vitreimonas flagellata TaxID=2560861 RepID=UPI001074CDD1|nr:zf-HC2 domain-containing protein [Vitreimonas flagellata]